MVYVMTLTAMVIIHVCYTLLVYVVVDCYAEHGKICRWDLINKVAQRKRGEGLNWLVRRLIGKD